MLGTLPYMAPEQFHSPGDVDVRADLYAFGIVLFEMLAGRRPFLGPTVARIRRQHERYDPPSLVPVIPRKYRRHAEAIDEVVARCLRKSPRDRYVSAVELRRALTRVLKRIDPSFDPMA
jgi:serine/threonine-protein kinase